MGQRFNLPHFRCIAKVMGGEPSSEYKARVHEDILRQKQLKVDAGWKVEKGKKKEQPDGEDGKMEDVEELQAPRAVLTEVEEGQWFKESAVNDVTGAVMVSSFSNF